MADLGTLVALLQLAVKDRTHLALENIAVRHQLAVYKRSVKRPTSCLRLTGRRHAGVNHSRGFHRAESSRPRPAGYRSQPHCFALGTQSHGCEPRASGQTGRRAQVACSGGLATLVLVASFRSGCQPPRAPSCLPPEAVAPRSQRLCELRKERAIGPFGYARACLGSQNRTALGPSRTATRWSRFAGRWVRYRSGLELELLWGPVVTVLRTLALPVSSA